MSEKIRDNHGRWRNKTIAFRVTPEEYEKIKAMVEISGMTTQNYIIKCLEDREVVVVGNPRVYKALKHHMEQLYQEISTMADASELDPEKWELLAYLGKVYEEMRKDSNMRRT